MNTEIRSYNLISKVIHWGSALLILGLLAVGMTLENMEKGPEKFELLGLHKSFGVGVVPCPAARWVQGLVEESEQCC